MGTAISTESRIVSTAMLTVGQMRCPIIWVTGVLEMSDVPSSPCKSSPTHVMNCSCNGSARPSDVRMRSSWSGVAISPAMIAAGSPVVSLSSRKTKMATMIMTGMTARMRRVM